MHALNDVAALAEFAQRRLGLVAYRPLAGADLFGKAQRFQLAQAPDLQRMELVGPLARMGCEIDDAATPAIAHELAVELRPALGLDLAFECPSDIEVGAWAKLLGYEIARPVAHTFLDVVASDDEVFTVLAHATHDQMDMRMLGVPVIDGDPVELGAEIFLHLPDEITGEGSQVGHLQRIVWRDDEAEMMPVVLAALGEVPAVRFFLSRPEQASLLSVSGDAVAAQIVEMGAERRGAP